LSKNWSSVINFRINIIAICFFMTFCISYGQLFLILLVILNIFLKISWLTTYLSIEFLLIIFFFLKSFKFGN
jgi:hypothetical protein